MQWWFKKFGKRDESLEDEDCSGQLSEVDNNQLRVITEADPHSYKRSCQGTQLQSTTLWSFNIWIKSERQKSSISGFLICWPKTKKIIDLKHRLLLFYARTMNHLLIWWKVDFMTTSDKQLSGWTKKTLQSISQSQTCTNKRSRSYSLVVCCWSASLQLSESRWNYYIWEVCSANWWDTLKTATPAAGIGQQNVSNSSPW